MGGVYPIQTFFGFLYFFYIYKAPKALPGAYKARTKSAPNPLQNTLHGKRALGLGLKFDPNNLLTLTIATKLTLTLRIRVTMPG